MTEQQLMLKIDKLEHSMQGLKDELDCIKSILEDSVLTDQEAKMVDESVSKIKKGDKSDFVPLEEAKRSIKNVQNRNS